MMRKHRGKAIFEMFLLVASVIAFAYILHESSYDNSIIVEKRGISFSNILRIIINLMFSERTLVSAFEVSDLQDGIATCVVGKDGSLCQEYIKSECNAKCNENCFPTTRENVPGCEIGTCFDANIGTCSIQSPKAQCEDKGGQWLNDAFGNVAQCQTACCVIGDKVKPLITEKECQIIGEREGIDTEYRTDIKTELECLNLERQQAEGACIFYSGEDKRCDFTSKVNCINSGGDFHEGLLCSHPDFSLGIEKQANVRCVGDKLYWYDSDGNRENIYDANKVRSWNDGKVLSESESCSLGNSRDAFTNQKTCGNCNRFTGSVCGEKTANEKLSDANIDFVCRDMRCRDSNGNLRENGESWCEYQGQVGVDEGRGGLRSVETPGSRHFRAACIDGEVQIDPCSDYRNEICVEERAQTSGNEISNAACIRNLWQLCLSYNTEIEGDTKQEIKEATERRDKLCNENPHCLLKEVNIDDGFKFNTCVPKYAPGFDLQANAGGSQISCALATNKCVVFYVKEISGWKCVANCQCEKEKFAEQMNDLCMSLGDCGASVNYIGELTENYGVSKKSPKLDKEYLNGIRQYSETKPGQYIESGNVTQYLDAIGKAIKLGGGDLASNSVEELEIGGTISGVTGTVLIVLGYSAAFASLAIAFAVTAFLIKFTDIDAGLDPAIVWTLVGAGAFGGAIIVASSATAAGLTGGALAGFGSALGSTILPILGTVGWVPIIGLIIIVLVVITIVVFKAIGVGDTKKRFVEFECYPWQPHLGGEKCGECGKDGYPCSKYSCQSLGVNCRLLNEGTSEQICTNIGEGDITPPKIKPWQDALSGGFRYEDVSERGYNVVKETGDGCIASNEVLSFGISLEDKGPEPGQCRYDVVHKDNYDEMEFGFGSTNLFLENHVQIYTIPDLTSLIPGYDPARRADINLFVRCIDGNGNGKDSAEYVINLCAKPGKDETGPVITHRTPENEFVRHNLTELDASVFTLEPADCRWSLDSKRYDEMENNFECKNDIIEQTIFGWECETTFPIIKDENVFYVQCKDQPWYGIGWQGEGSDTIEPDESKRNEMPKAYEFVVKRTKTELKIDSIKPNNETLLFGVQPATVILEVRTSGGVDNGKATCYLFGSEMSETFGTLHKQVFNRIYEGEYVFPITCQDSVGNSASGESRFIVELDVNAPKVTRVYDGSNSLTIITNEAGECAFSKNSCSFSFENGTLMGGSEIVHTTELDDNTYYVKCKDKWGNAPGECSVIVRKGVF